MSFQGGQDAAGWHLSVGFTALAANLPVSSVFLLDYLIHRSGASPRPESKARGPQRRDYEGDEDRLRDLLSIRQRRESSDSAVCPSP
jgi:hypothetical protein